MADLVPEPVERRRRLELGVDELGPIGCRAGRDAPVDRAIVRDLHPFLHAREDVTAEPLRIEVVEEMRCGRPRQRDRRRVRTSQLEDTLSPPRRDVLERLVAHIVPGFLVRSRRVCSKRFFR